MQAREDLAARLVYSDDTSHLALRERGIVGGGGLCRIIVSTALRDRNVETKLRLKLP